LIKNPMPGADPSGTVLDGRVEPAKIVMLTTCSVPAELPHSRPGDRSDEFPLHPWGTMSRNLAGSTRRILIGSTARRRNPQMRNVHALPSFHQPSLTASMRGNRHVQRDEWESLSDWVVVITVYLSFAEHFSVVPLFIPSQVHFHGFLPVTAEASPASQKSDVGALKKLSLCRPGKASPVCAIKLPIDTTGARSYSVGSY